MQSQQTFPPEEAFPKAKEAAARALEIDDTLAEAHASLAWVRSNYDWDWPGAEREFKRTIELNPNYTEVFAFHTGYLGAMGRLDESLAELKRAEEMEPLLPINSTLVGRALYLARQHDQAIEQLQRVIETDANFPLAHLYLGLAYEQKGMFEEAIAEFQKGSSLLGGDPRMAGALGHAYAVSGRKDRAQNLLVELKQLSKRRYVAPFEILSTEDRQRVLNNMRTIILTSNRRVDITLSNPGQASQESVRQYPFNAADSLTLLDTRTRKAATPPAKKKKTTKKQ